MVVFCIVVFDGGGNGLVDLGIKEVIKVFYCFGMLLKGNVEFLRMINY